LGFDEYGKKNTSLTRVSPGGSDSFDSQAGIIREGVQKGLLCSKMRILPLGFTPSKQDG
jgi:hypothetical protein